jgi:putative PIN family toxin of toxin-antitoxin system
MRLVIDTNIFISAALKDKSFPAVTLHLSKQHGILLKSDATERQLFDVLARPHFRRLVSPATLEWFRALMNAAELVTITERIVACRDPTDDKFLELAVNGGADRLVSGDVDLLVLNPFRGIPIVFAAAFVKGFAAT